MYPKLGFCGKDCSVVSAPASLTLLNSSFLSNQGRRQKDGVNSLCSFPQHVDGHFPRSLKIRMTECFLRRPNILTKLTNPHISGTDMLLSLSVNAFHSSGRMSLFYCWYLEQTYIFNDPISLKGYIKVSATDLNSNKQFSLRSRMLCLPRCFWLYSGTVCFLIEVMQWETQCNMLKDQRVAGKAVASVGWVEG